MHIVLPSIVQTHRALFKFLAKTFNFFMKSSSVRLLSSREVSQTDTEYVLLFIPTHLLQNVSEKHKAELFVVTLRPCAMHYFDQWQSLHQYLGTFQ